MPAKAFGETRYSPPSLSHIWPRSHKFPIPILVCSSELLASGYRVQGVPASEAQPSCLGGHIVLSLAKQLAERHCSNQCLQWKTNIADFFVPLASSPGLQEKQRETTGKTLLTTAKHLLMFLCRTDRGTGDPGMRENSSQTSLPSTLQKGTHKSLCAGSSPFPLGTFTEEKSHLNDYEGQIWSEKEVREA